MPAVAVRHERRKQKNSKAHLLDGTTAPLRPNQLHLKPHNNKSASSSNPHEGGGCPGSPLTGSRAASTNVSRQGSRAGTPEDPTHMETYVMYGDECFYGKVIL